MMMQTVLITGANGLIGSMLSKMLIKKGYRVITLSRSPKTNLNDNFEWNIENNYLDNNAILSCDYIVHLAGENIGDKRWTAKQKEIIVSSRIKSARLLYDYTLKNNKKLKAFISASGVNYYGTNTSNHTFNENNEPGKDFLAVTCKHWENEADNFLNCSQRVVKLRTGVVLSSTGGALIKIVSLFKYNLGAVLASGKQYMPWIHLHDICMMYIFAIENNNLNGAYNAVAPQYITNKYFTNKLALYLNKKIILPAVPKFVLKFILGQRALLLTEGSKIDGQKIIDAGFNFKYYNIDKAFEHLFYKK